MSRAELAITVAHESAVVPRRFRRLVEPLVTAPAVGWAAGGPVVGVRATVSAGAAVADEFLFPAKLAWAVAADLDARGVRVRVQDASGRGPLIPSPGGVFRLSAAAPPLDVAVPYLVRRHSTRGAFVGTVNRAHTAHWVRILQRAGLGRPVMDGRAYAARTPGGNKVVVTALTHLNYAQPHEFDLVVVPDARPLRGIRPALSDHADPYADYRLARHAGVAAFGFVPAGMTLTPAERLTLEALFGPEPRHAAAPPVAVRAECDPTPPPPNAPDPRADARGYRRAAVWANAPRTAWVAGLARAAAAASPARVLVLADAAHAAALAAATGWPELAAGHCGPVPPHAVATAAWADRQRPLAAGVLIDARGWEAIDLVGFPPRGVVSVTLIDAGAAGAAGGRLTARRLAQYRGRGWAVATPR